MFVDHNVFILIEWQWQQKDLCLLFWFCKKLQAMLQSGHWVSCLLSIDTSRSTKKESWFFEDGLKFPIQVWKFIYCFFLLLNCIFLLFSWPSSYSWWICSWILILVSSDRTLYQLRHQNGSDGPKDPPPKFKRTPSTRRTVPSSYKQTPLVEPEVPFVEPNKGKTYFLFFLYNLICRLLTLI